MSASDPPPTPTSAASPSDPPARAHRRPVSLPWTHPSWRPRRARLLLAVAVLGLLAVAGFYGRRRWIIVHSPLYRAQRLLDLAKIELELGRVDAASDALREALRLAPEKAGLVAQIAAIYSDRLSQPDDAEVVLRLGLQREPNEPRLKAQLAAVLDDRRRLAAAAGRDPVLDEAERVLRAAVRMQPDRVELAVELATFLLGNDRAADAAAVVSGRFDAIRALPSPTQRGRGLAVGGLATAQAGHEAHGVALMREGATHGTPAERAACLFQLGVFLREAGRQAEALAALQEAHDLDPRRLDLVLSLESALAAQATGLDELERLLNGAIEAHPDASAPVVRLAAAWSRAERWAEAEQVLRERLTRTPDEVEVRTALSALLVERGRPHEAYELIQPALTSARHRRADALRCRVFLTAGRAAAESGLPDEAVVLLLEAERAGPVEARLEGTLSLGRTLLALGRPTSAREKLAQAKALDPGSPWIALLLGQAEALLGRREEARALLQPLLLHASQLVRFEAAQALGEILVRDTDFEEQLQREVERAAANGAQDVVCLLEGARALGLRDFVAAEGAFSRLAAVVPSSPSPHMLRAHAARLAGAQDRERGALGAALSVRPDFTEAELRLLAIDVESANWTAARVRATRLLDDRGARPEALRALVLSYSQPGADPQEGSAVLASACGRWPNDRLLRLHAAVFAAAVDPVKGAAALAEVISARDQTTPLELLALLKLGRSDDLEAVECLTQLARDPRLGSARVVLASLYERLGRTDLATQELDGIGRAQPEFADACLARARMAVTRGDLETAASELTQLPAGRQAWLFLAQVLFRQGKPQAAREAAERVSRKDPSYQRALALVGRARARSGEHDEALAAFTAARRLAPTAHEGYEAACVHLLRGELEQAKALFDQAAQATGSTAYLRACAASCAALLARPAEAVKAFGPESTSMTPGERVLGAMLARWSGRVVAPDDTPDPSIPPECWEAVRALAPLGPEAPAEPYRSLLTQQLLAIMGWSWETETWAGGVADASDANSIVVWWALELLAPDARPAVRLKLLQRQAELCPSWPAAGLKLARAQRAAGDAAGALVTLEAWVGRFPTDTKLSLQLALTLHEGGQLERGLELYRDLVGRDAPPPEALNNLAYLLKDDATQRSQAIGHARRAVELAPDRPQFHATLGWLLHLDHQLEEAVRHLSRAVVMAPTDPTNRYQLACALNAVGETTRAVDHLEVALLCPRPFAERADCQRLAREWTSKNEDRPR